MSFEPFQNFFTKAAVHWGIPNEVLAAKVCNQAQKSLDTIFEKQDQYEKHLSPAHFKDSTITIYVSNPAWAQEVITRKSKIIDDLNTRLGKKVIKDLRTQISS